MANGGAMRTGDGAQRPWWQTGWIVVATLILFFPVGLFAMWKGRLWRLAVRWGLTGLAALLVVVVGAGGGASPSPSSVPQAASAASPTASPSSTSTARVTASPTPSGPSASPTPSVVGAAPAASPVPTHATSVSTGTQAAGGELLLDGGAVVLPDAPRTPGATYAQVTQANIHQTICRTGFTSTIRPSSSYTASLKEQQLASGYTYHGDTSTSDYEEDHLISLELGGGPSDARNLWPEPYAATDGARVKDKVENKLHDLVCSGALSLATAQHAIATNWWQAYQRYGGEGSPTVWEGSYTGGSSSSTGGSGSTTSTGGSTSGTSDPSSATAQCADGTYSYSQHRSGTCSHHGGVARWINPPPS